MYRNESLVTRVQKFFYDEEVPFGLATCRIVLPIVMMGMVFPRWFACRELYSADGATGQLSTGYGYIDMLPELSGTAVSALYAVMLFTLVTICIGWCTRISAFISFALFTYFSMLDCVSTMTKYSVICSHILLLLSLSECGSIWSVDSWLLNRKRTGGLFSFGTSYPKSPAWPRRLMQLLIGFIYFGAAMTKIHTPSFFTGDQLEYWMLTHLNFKHPIGELLSLYPVLLVSFGYIVVVWEVVFIFCAWKSSWRGVILPVGVLFHFMTALTLGLLMFPMVCFSAYLSFMDEDDVQKASAWGRRQMRRFAWLKVIPSTIKSWQASLPSHPEWKTSAQVCFAVAIPVIAVIGVGLEYSWDIYGERRSEGRHQLAAIDPDLAQEMLAPVRPQRDIDKFLAVDLGTFLISDLLADRRSSYRPGETVLAQCHLVPPHGDMVVECKIRDSNHRQVGDRIVAVAMREMFRVNFTFPIPDTMTPGEYDMTIETAGRHVLKRKFTVLPKSNSVAVLGTVSSH